MRRPQSPLSDRYGINLKEGNVLAYSRGVKNCAKIFIFFGGAKISLIKKKKIQLLGNNYRSVMLHVLLNKMDSLFIHADDTALV